MMRDANRSTFALLAVLKAGIATGLVMAGAARAAEEQSAQPAQSAQAGGLEELVVTAQRRTESAQNVPIAITSFSAESLEAKGILSTLGLVQFVPNLFGANNTGLGSANAYYIRGLGNTESIATFDPAVGTYIDEIYLSRQNANNFNFFDVERVEVLRGPQGTLFGRNTTGGAVSVVLRRPGTTFGGFAEASYGAYNRVLLRGAVDMPLAAGVGLKISGYYQDDRGFAINTTTGERVNDSDGVGLRGDLRLNLTDNFEWNGSVTYIRSAGENLANFECDPRNPANCNGRFVTTGLRRTTNSTAPMVISGRKAGFGLGNNTDTMIYASNFEWRGENITLNLITGFVDLKQQFHLDFADGRSLPSIADPVPTVRGFPLGGFGIINDGFHSQFSQEVKLTGALFDGRIDYVAGAFFFDEANTTDFADTFAIFTGGPNPLQLLLADRTLRNTTRASAGYVQADFNLTEKLKLTGGIRYTDETKTFAVADNRPQCQGVASVTCINTASLIGDNGRPIPTRQNARVWTPRFVVNYQANRDLLLFASATRGFKSGGWNARGTRASELLPFGPETVWSYEAGFKSEWFDRRLRVNVTAYYLENKDLQAPSAFVRPDNSIAFITQNFADYRNRGIEVELTAVPTDGLNLFLNFGYQDDNYAIDSNAPDFNAAGIKSAARQQRDCKAQLAAGRIPLAPAAFNAPDCAAGIVDANGNLARPVRTPAFTVAGGATYDWALPGAGIIVSPNINATWRSNYETGTANATIYTGSITRGSTTFPANPFAGTFITGSEGRAHLLVNAGIIVRTEDRNWTFAVECQNCLDQAWRGSSLANVTYLAYPRYWQVRLKRVF